MKFWKLRGIFLGLVVAGTTQFAWAGSFPMRGPTVSGNVAQLRHGVACAPEKAPLAVKRAIWAGNQLRKRPYRFGGGHRAFADSGYDCSGTVSYALAAAGLIRVPMNSRDLSHYGRHGQGKWITVYARNGHAFAIIAGLRLDTTAWNSRSDREAPRWQVTNRPPRGSSRGTRLVSETNSTRPRQLEGWALRIRNVAPARAGNAPPASQEFRPPGFVDLLEARSGRKRAGLSGPARFISRGFVASSRGSWKEG